MTQGEETLIKHIQSCSGEIPNIEQCTIDCVMTFG